MPRTRRSSTNVIIACLIAMLSMSISFTNIQAQAYIDVVYSLKIIKQ